MKIVTYADLGKDFFEYQEIEEIDSVNKIISDVRTLGDEAVQKYTHKFDEVLLERFRVDHTEIKAAYHQLDEAVKKTLIAAAENIERFARKQKLHFQDFEYEIQPGVFTGQKIIPISRVGVYAPGGEYPLPSTVLMCSIPAKVAGVKEKILCSPPTFQSAIHPAILGAAYISQVDEVYQIGGVQAIAAMAYGTKSIRAVDKIVGPGNKYVTAAKKMVYGQVGIDFIAGPTELLIIADENANPAYIAADLLAQAEHDTNAVPVLVTMSSDLAELVNVEIDRQLSELKTKVIAQKSLKTNGCILLIDTIDQAIEVANRKAPEHLELQVNQSDTIVNRLKNYGSLFIGSYAAEVLGDYSSGLNHTLPTNACARYTGGLSVKDFFKMQTTLRVTEEGLSNIGPVAEKLSNVEGLDGHAKSVGIRLC